MEIAGFWRLVEAAKAESGGVCKAQADALRARLAELPAEEIVAFNSIFKQLHAQAYRWTLWGADCIMNHDPGGSGDRFIYFRSWLIGQGRAVYESAQEDPETLVEVEVGNDGYAECENLQYAAWYAYEDRTGETDMSEEYWYDPDQPVGEQWEEEDLERLYPRLWARYGWPHIEGGDV